MPSERVLQTINDEIVFFTKKELFVFESVSTQRESDNEERIEVDGIIKKIEYV